MKKVIFSDIDGTLVHASNKCDNLISLGENQLISQDAIDLIKKIKKNNKFILISGRRLSGFKKIEHLIPFDMAILEHGGVILNKKSFNKAWIKYLSDTIGDYKNKEGKIWDYERKLKKEGFTTNSKKCMASFRVYIGKEDNLTERKKRFIEEKLEKEGQEYGIKSIRNENSIEIIPIKSGKDNAIKFIEKIMKINNKNFFALGNELNDLPMINYVCNVGCPRNARWAVKRIVKKRGGYISKFKYHKATVDLLMNFCMR